MSAYLVKPSVAITDEYRELIRKLHISKVLFDGGVPILLNESDVTKQLSLIQDAKRLLNKIEVDTKVKIYKGELE